MDMLGKEKTIFEKKKWSPMRVLQTCKQLRDGSREREKRRNELEVKNNSQTKGREEIKEM